MYAPHFGLHKAPFSISPDPRSLYLSAQHREALAHLLYGLQSGGGFVLLTGEIGAGKTTLCRAVLEQCPPEVHVACVFNPRLNVTELLKSVLREFGVAEPPNSWGDGTATWVDALNKHLLTVHAAGGSCVLLVDEAQNLSVDVLEQLRLLTNLETSERKLLQIILVGQPELRDMVARPELEQLAQRITARFHLGTLAPQDISPYVAQRLTHAGWRGASPFDTAALKRIHALTRGVPRRINVLCDRAMLGAYAQQTHRISRAMLEQAAREVFTDVPQRWWQRLTR